MKPVVKAKPVAPQKQAAAASCMTEEIVKAKPVARRQQVTKDKPFAVAKQQKPVAVAKPIAKAKSRLKPPSINRKGVALSLDFEVKCSNSVACVAISSGDAHTLACLLTLTSERVMRHWSRTGGTNQPLKEQFGPHWKCRIYERIEC